MHFIGSALFVLILTKSLLYYRCTTIEQWKVKGIDKWPLLINRAVDKTTTTKTTETNSDIDDKKTKTESSDNNSNNNSNNNSDNINHDEESYNDIDATPYEDLEKRYTDQLNKLRSEITVQILPEKVANEDKYALYRFLSDDKLDDKLVPYVVLLEATPKGLAKFGHEGGKVKENLITTLLNDTNLMKQMLLADGATNIESNNNRFIGTLKEVSQYGPAMEIYTTIRGKNYTNEQLPTTTIGIATTDDERNLVFDDNTKGVFLAKLALAISLEHAIPIVQRNPQKPSSLSSSSSKKAAKFVDPIKRYRYYKNSYLNGELDVVFDQLNVWELRMVINGNEPDEILSWGRTMLRNYRPDNALMSNYHNRYVQMVRTNIRYGSNDVKYDLPQLQEVQNILMDGGVCGRRAYFGRFILRSFGIPTIERPSHGHGALAHWVPTTNPGDDNNWVINLGPNWGKGWTATRYHDDIDFLNSAKARKHNNDYWMVKRAQWVGDVLGEIRKYGGAYHYDDDINTYKDKSFWYDISLRVQHDIIHNTQPSKNSFMINNKVNNLSTTPTDDDDDDGNKKSTTLIHKKNIINNQTIVNNNGTLLINVNVNLSNDSTALAVPSTTTTGRVLGSFVSTTSKGIIYNQQDNSTEIVIPATAFSNPRRSLRGIQVMKSYDGGNQIYLTSFTSQGLTILRGGTWKNDAKSCDSGTRLKSAGYGKYENWGFRVAVSKIIDGECYAGNSSSDILSLDLDSDDGETLDLIYIEPGSFIMGGESTIDGRFQCIEVPKHQVQLTTGYYIGIYPVTQSQYHAIMKSNPSRSTKDPNCPVDNIGLDDAIDFCDKLAEITGVDVRLPTEAEWEYASRAGTSSINSTNGTTTTNKWFFGNDPSNLDDYAWYKDNANYKSHPVGLKKPNQWGLFDIYGNVYERVSDRYAKNYYSISPTIDPMGPSEGINSKLEYKINILQSGLYSLTVQVVTVNYNQNLIVSLNEYNEQEENKKSNNNNNNIVMKLPYTNGNWEESLPVTLTLKEGENMIHFWRANPPQYGIAIKSFTLKSTTNTTTVSKASSTVSFLP